MTLTRIGFIQIPPGDKPGFDHADVYRPGRRMCVAHTGADRVDVLDYDTHTFLRSIPDLPGVAGVLIDEQHDLLFTSDRGIARVSVFRASDEQLLGRIAVGPHPNGLAYDRRRRRLYAFNLGEPLGENCTVSVVDVDAMRVVAELPLPGRPRWAVYDDECDCVYAAIREPAEIAVIDCDRHRFEGRFMVPADGPHGLWLDRGRLFCAADGGQLIALDRGGGEVLARLPLPGVPDVIMLDPERTRTYVAIGDPGLVCSFDTGRLEHLETVTTEPGAHTSAGNPTAAASTCSAPRAAARSSFEERG